ncbi:hypothetical protein VP01_2938g2 [Puccinia sorghi]|uniref:Uncharacterized protein n=1 Tax=Puccinia sorghi TaxID=27349 RepID=A0A0L6V2V0_9BASI|nr:hypothetical protein VP01_2938g2 [Puccinia sorghi]
MPLRHLDWNPISKKILTVLLAIYPSLSPTLPTYPTKTMIPHPSHFSCGSKLNRPLVTWLKKTLNINFSGFNGIMDSPRRLKGLLEKSKQMSMKNIQLKATGELWGLYSNWLAQWGAAHQAGLNNGSHGASLATPNLALSHSSSLNGLPLDDARKFWRPSKSAAVDGSSAAMISRLCDTNYNCGGNGTLDTHPRPLEFTNPALLWCLADYPFAFVSGRNKLTVGVEMMWRKGGVGTEGFGFGGLSGHQRRIGQMRFIPEGAAGVNRAGRASGGLEVAQQGA